MKDLVPGFEFALLGPVRARHDGVPVDLGQPRTREVLAVLLAAAGRTVALPLLVDGVWDEGDRPARAEHSARTHVWRLRRALARHTAEPVLVTVGDGYALQVPARAVDTWAFERALARAAEVRASGGPAEQAREVLSEALGLWTGEPLAGLHGPHARALRAHLADVRQSLLEARLELDAELGDRPHLAAEAAALVMEYPASQRLRAVQMLALYRSGRQAEALAAYEDTRRYLAAELAHVPPEGRGPCAELAALHRRILRSDPSLRLTGTGADSRRRVPDGPAFPSAIGGFTGRAEQIRELTETLTRPDTAAVVLSAVNGMAGVGKTTLAVHTAHRLDDAFPDGRLYVDLRGADAEPLQPHAVLEGFLRELGTAEEDIPEGADERVARYRSLMAGRRMLLLLDNAASCEQLRPLIPGAAGCAVLVTSRAWLTGLPGARHLRLDVMPLAEALALLRRAVGDRAVDRDPEAAAALAAACGFLPLALRIVASRLAAEPGRTLADMVRRLTDERGRLDELRTGDTAVEAAFELSYATLTAGQARAFRLLSVVDVPDLALPSAAALLGLGADEAEELLESLVELNLLESHRLDRYHFHDLVRAFARARSAREDSPGTTARAVAGLLDFCLATARNADAVAHSAEPGERTLIDVAVASPGLDFATAQEATEWMREETALQRMLIARACADETLPLSQAADLIDRLNTVLSGIAHLTAVTEQARLVAEVAARRGDRRSEALARYVRGNALWHANSFPEAESELTRSLQLGDGETGVRLRASAHLTLCANARVHGRFDAAVAHGEASVRLFHALGAATAEGTALGELAFNYARQDRLTEAREAAERGARLVGGQESVSKAIGLYYLARVLRLCGDREEALRRADEGLALFRTLNVSSFEAASGNLIAELQAEGEQYALAAQTAEAFLPLARRVSAMLEGGLLRTLGRSLPHLGQHARADACLQAALELFERLRADQDAEQIRQLRLNKPADR
ncbi:winged helix-turn-helix domain-containing protein [Streptomyces sp. SCA3-4]|uniref:AfsR/SARP family transcriptional regulator n=1 Tax=Streptomyces sichuanensis TaxID=2871810 RepID=UPI001CE3636A|nr:AfsR/SARP family transcriptional regulator [Streptomyces sichuanensis]MCA6091342.1 winged helix-turn-helix domain-containing protein [Streptomyces sichuanensis]